MPYWNWAGKIAYFGLKIGKVQRTGPNITLHYPLPKKIEYPPPPQPKKKGSGSVIIA